MKSKDNAGFLATMVDLLAASISVTSPVALRVYRDDQRRSPSQDYACTTYRRTHVAAAAQTFRVNVTSAVSMNNLGPRQNKACCLYRVACTNVPASSTTVYEHVIDLAARQC
jgi:hypothetical protein